MWNQQPNKCAFNQLSQLTKLRVTFVKLSLPNSSNWKSLTFKKIVDKNREVPFCCNGPLEKTPRFFWFTTPVPKRSWTFTWNLGLLDQSLVFFVKGVPNFHDFHGTLFPRNGSDEDYIFSKKTASKYSSTFVCTAIQILDKRKLTKIEKIGFQIIFLEISDLQSAIKTLRPWSFLDLDEFISEFQRGLVLHTAWKLYPGLPNSCWEGVWKMVWGAKYLFTRCLEAWKNVLEWKFPFKERSFRLYLNWVPRTMRESWEKTWLEGEQWMFSHTLQGGAPTSYKSNYKHYMYQ